MMAIFIPKFSSVLNILRVAHTAGLIGRCCQRNQRHKWRRSPQTRTVERRNLANRENPSMRLHLAVRTCLLSADFNTQFALNSRLQKNKILLGGDMQKWPRSDRRWRPHADVAERMPVNPH
jgi:hypothetical protein